MRDRRQRQLRRAHRRDVDAQVVHGSPSGRGAGRRRRAGSRGVPRVPPCVGVWSTRLIDVRRLEDPERRAGARPPRASRRCRPRARAARRARAISCAKRSMSERWLAKNTCSPRMKKFSSPMFSEHISGREQHGVEPLLDRQPRAAAGRELDHRVGLRAQPLVQLAVDRRVHRVRAVGVARVHVQDRGARLATRRCPARRSRPAARGGSGWPPCRGCRPSARR